MSSGQTLASWTAAAGVPAVTNGATLDVVLNTADTTDSNTPVLDFDPSTIEYADFYGVMPNQYSAGGTTVNIEWLSSVQSAGASVVWGAQWKLRGDVDTDAYASAQETTVGTTATVGQVQTASIAFTDGAQMDSVVAESGFALRVYRNTADGDDAIGDDISLVTVNIKET